MARGEWISSISDAPGDRRRGAPTGPGRGRRGHGIVGRWAGVVLSALLLSAAAACTESPTEAELEEIEEVDFAPELGIDLSEFTMRQTGVYFRDVVQGPDSAATATFGTVPTITFTGWLTDGSVFAEGTVGFVMGNFQMPIGLEEGMLNQRVGGTRMILVPPNLGFGGIEQVHVLGTKVVPAGSVLVYEVVLDGVGDQ